MKSKISGGAMSACLGLAGGLVRAAAAASALASFSVGSTGPVGLGLLGIAGVLSAYSQVAYAGSLTVCNNARETISVAVAYNGARGEFVSKGWWTINGCGGCATILQQQETTEYDQVYLYAEFFGSAGTFIEGQYRFCVGVGVPFTYSQAPNCNARGFRQFQVNLNKQFTETLNSSGRGECLKQ